jgi:hypothetical protein
MWRASQLVDDFSARGPSGRAVDAVRCSDGDKQLRVTLAELVRQELARPRRFRCRVLKSAGGQAVCHGDTKDGQGQCEEGCHHDDASWTGDRHPCNLVQQCPLFCLGTNFILIG